MTKKDDSGFWPEQLSDDGPFPESGLLREKWGREGKEIKVLRRHGRCEI